MIGPDPRAEPDLHAMVTAAATLAAMGHGEHLDRLFAARRDDLMSLARRLAEAPGDGASVTPTALVHRAHLHLLAEHAGDRARLFFRAAFAGIARRILVDRARGRHAPARSSTALGSGNTSGTPGACDQVAPDLIALDHALAELADLPGNGARMARVAELRVFLRMTELECAEALGVSARTVAADWQLARRFLQARLSPP